MQVYYLPQVQLQNMNTFENIMATIQAAAPLVQQGAKLG